MAHSVIEVRFRYIRGRVAFAGTYPHRRIGRAVVGSGSEFISPGGGDLNEHIIGFRDANEKTVLFDRLHVQAVRGNDGHRAAGEFKMKIGGGRAVNDAQPHGFIGLGRQGRFRLAIGKKAIVGHVRYVHGRHALELSPEVVAEHVEAGGAENALSAAFLYRIPPTAALECSNHFVRVLVGPVGEEDNVVMVGLRAILAGHDDDGTVHPSLFLQACVGMIPVGSALANGKFIRKGSAGLNGREADVGDAVHIGGHEHAVPVDGGFHAHFVMDMDAGEVSLFEAQGRAGNASVDCHARRRLSGDVDLLLGDGELIFDRYCLGLYMGKENKED